MPTIDVMDSNRQKVRSITLPKEVFGCKPHAALVHEAVTMQRACERQGTASTLGRGEVRGSGKKPWKQKHTGRARAGSVRSPIWRHGGIVFGPRPRSYAYSIPKKKYHAALRSALSARLAEGAVMVLSDLSLPEPKTKLLAKMLTKLGLTSKTLIVLGNDGGSIERAARNLSDVKLTTPESLNVYDVLRYHAIVIPEGVLSRLQEVWL